jgi:hypothetical protein
MSKYVLLHILPTRELKWFCTFNKTYSSSIHNKVLNDQFQTSAFIDQIVALLRKLILVVNRPNGLSSFILFLFLFVQKDEACKIILF